MEGSRELALMNPFPAGHWLEALLFLIFINDLDDGISGIIQSLLMILS